MCKDCSAARETSGLWRMFDPLCIYCGARLLQRIPKFCRTNAEASQRRKAALDDWMKYGHAEAEIRALVAGPAAYEPVKKEKK